jgi:hypothetical protein
MSITFKKIAKSVTGLSTPVFGVSWNPPTTEREVVRKLVLFLEDRRALYHPYDMEDPHYVVDSILQIRKHLSDVLQTLDESSGIIAHLRAMRAACRKFLDFFDQKKLRRRFYYPDSLTALGELRGVFGLQIAQLCAKYGIDVDGELEMILPAEDQEEHKPRKQANG